MTILAAGPDGHEIKVQVIIGKRRIENVRADFLFFNGRLGHRQPPSTTNTRRPVIERQAFAAVRRHWLGPCCGSVATLTTFTPAAIKFDGNTCKNASDQTYVDNDSFAKVMVVWNGLEGSNPRVLTEGVESDETCAQSAN